jgi:hypothetical protein
MNKENAIVEIRYDTNTKKMRARYENSWVRFPKELRKHGTKYVVALLREGKSGSWIACGKIEPIPPKP